MENIDGTRNITKCQSLKDLEDRDRDKTFKKTDSLPNLLKLTHCEINFSQLKKKEEKNSETFTNGHCEPLQKTIPFQQKVEILVGNSHKQEKPENSGKIGLFQWFLRFFGVFFVSLRFHQTILFLGKVNIISKPSSHSLRSEFEKRLSLLDEA